MLDIRIGLNHKAIELFVKENSDMRLLDMGNRFNISAGHTGLIWRKLGLSYKAYRFGNPNQERLEEYELTISQRILLMLMRVVLKWIQKT